MNFQNIDFDTLTLIGPFIRTNHADAANDIPAFWAKVMESGVLFELGAKDSVYAVYTDYDSDWTGAYTMMLGIPYTKQDVIDGVNVLEIPAQTCAKTLLEDNSPPSIFGAWSYIWNQWPARDQRTYTSDIEIHALDPEDRSIELRIACQPH